MSNRAIVDNHGVTLRTRAQTKTRTVHLQTQCFCEVAVAVSNHDQFFCVCALTPGVHDEGIVHRQADDAINALGFQRICVNHIAR